VTVEIPAEVRNPPPRAPLPLPKPDMERLAGAKVLVADDNKDILMLLEVYLSQVGIKVDYAENGLKAVEMAKKGDYDLVLMDIQMPVLDGYEATATLRAKDFNKPIIALTANAMKEDRDKCLASGCNDYITKPFRKNEIYEVISRFI
jgi:CheY-like chemotaxis protein